MKNKYESDDDKICYAMGLNFASQMMRFPVKMNEELFIHGFMDIVDGRQPDFSQEEYASVLDILQTRLNKQHAEHCHCDSCNHGEDCQANMKAGAEYREANAKKEGVEVTKSGLQIQHLVQGTGTSPKATSTVRVHYAGKTIDGKVFDSSVERGQPIEFPLNHVIAGWTEGLQLMKEGGKAILTIPPELGYGEQGAGDVIPPQATLIFEVELIKVL